MNQRGFTLLELIVVIFLIALSAGFIFPRLSHDEGAAVEQEAEKFAALVNYCKEEAIVGSEPVAIFIDPAEARYIFLRLGKTDWQEIQGDDVLRPRTVQKPVSVKVLKLEKNVVSRTVPPADKSSQKTQKNAKKKKNPYKNAPLIVVDSLGRLTPFELAFYFEDAEFRVKPGEDGRAQVNKRNDNDQG